MSTDVSAIAEKVTSNVKSKYIVTTWEIRRHWQHYVLALILARLWRYIKYLLITLSCTTIAVRGRLRC